MMRWFGLRVPICVAGVVVATVSTVAAVAVGARAADRESAAPIQAALADLKHPEAHRRVSALRALRGSEDPQVLAGVAATLADPVEQVQIEAINAVLWPFLERKAEPRTRVGLIFEVRGAGIAGQAFTSGPMAVRPGPVLPDIVKGLFAATDSRSPRAAVDATFALGVVTQATVAVGDVTSARLVFETLAARLGYANPEQRIATTRVLGRLFFVCGSACVPAGDDLTGNALVGAMNDGVADVRRGAIWALGALRYDRAVKALTDWYTFRRKGAEALDALDALARIGHPSSREFFKTLLGQNVPAVRRAAVEGIARAGGASGAAEIEGAVTSDPSDAVRLAAAFAQQRAGRAARVDDIVAASASGALGEQARAYLVELGAPIEMALHPHLGHANPDVRLAVVTTLGLTGSSASLGLLDPLRRDPDSRVAAAAEAAMEWIRTRR